MEFPRDVRRRFRAVAGFLEVLEHAFAALAVERNALLEVYKQRYQSNDGGIVRMRFDVARLLAFLEIERPDGTGWRKAEREGRPFPAGLAVAAVGALESAALRNAAQLRRSFGTDASDAWSRTLPLSRVSSQTGRRIWHSSSWRLPLRGRRS
jgi:hypothetical protein